MEEHDSSPKQVLFLEAHTPRGGSVRGGQEKGDRLGVVKSENKRDMKHTRYQ